jgi:hypothetical protein
MRVVCPISFARLFSLFSELLINDLSLTIEHFNTSKKRNTGNSSVWKNESKYDGKAAESSSNTLDF